MQDTSSNHFFPLSGRDIHHVPRAEILQATETAPTIYQQEGVTIVRVHQSTVLKYGCGVHLSEARNMRFVQNQANIRIPTVIDAWELEIPEPGENRRMGYILMEYINGETLSNIWSTLDASKRTIVYAQIYQFLQQLHSIKMTFPGSLDGDISRGPLFTDYGAGPFKSPQDMESWFNERLLVCQEFGRLPSTQPSFSGLFDELVMCHMDIHPRNLILDVDDRLYLLDWAYAGGYPVFFETANLMRTGDPDFSHKLLDMIGDEHVEKAKRLVAVGFALTTGALTKPTKS
ncbi:MAG: hypothetical protein M1834_006894 [Cirrosporium novae-zelandiae]|nr:MAG: hypothetical protein M1834_006894 [Cirrosporium novae-zelandiae]